MKKEEFDLRITRNFGYCSVCGKPKTVYTKKCVECLHKNRIGNGKYNGADWVEELKY